MKKTSWQCKCQNVTDFSFSLSLKYPNHNSNLSHMISTSHLFKLTALHSFLTSNSEDLKGKIFLSEYEQGRIHSPPVADGWAGAE